METETKRSASLDSDNDEDEDVDPIDDIIDYLVRCAKISFKNAHVDEAEVKTNEKIRMASELFKQSPVNFLLQFGKYLAPYHVDYFLNLPITNDSEGEKLKQCLKELKTYHSDASRRKRVRNRRFKALQKLQEESDYFSDKEMMFRNPLLYEQLVGQYLTDEEIKERDGVDSENLTLLSMILGTVDRNQMNETKHNQCREECDADESDCDNEDSVPKPTSRWGEFDVPEAETSSKKPQVRKQTYISAPERRLLREEFNQEMYSSFIEGRDLEVDYHSIDNNEQYDDLEQASQDAEDKYFDSEPTDVENLEEHMKLVEVYGKKDGKGEVDVDDSLDIFMEHLNKRSVDC